MSKESNPLAMGRPRLASVKEIDQSERVTTPDKPEEGDRDWLLGKLWADHEHHKMVIKADGDETRAILNDVSTRLATVETKLSEILRLAPTEREKAAIKWLIGVVVTAILARFGIDAVNMP